MTTANNNQFFISGFTGVILASVPPATTTVEKNYSAKFAPAPNMAFQNENPKSDDRPPFSISIS